MLQQTQVATVVGYFHRFIERFPTVRHLANADEQQVLRLWQGLGYYSRARNLRRAARQIVEQFGGVIPSETGELLMLPGIGRYTAGAIASIAFGRRAALLDGNVARVLCRVCAIQSDPRAKKTSDLLWSIAQKILPNKNCGVHNEALMELGATICTPRKPGCESCPVRRFCSAADQGLQESIPPPRRPKPIPLEHRWTFVIRDTQKRVLIEQRPSTGRWAGMWQFITVPANGASPAGALRQALDAPNVRNLRKLGEVRHQLTHRRYLFEAFAGTVKQLEPGESRQWVQTAELKDYPLPKPHLAIAEMASGKYLARRDD